MPTTRIMQIVMALNVNLRQVATSVALPFRPKMRQRSLMMRTMVLILKVVVMVLKLMLSLMLIASTKNMMMAGIVTKKVLKMKCESLG